jgi:hypothetical protein
MLSSACSWIAFAVGLISAFEWWRASNIPVTDDPRAMSNVLDPTLPSAPFNPLQTSMGTLRGAAQRSGALNNRAALWTAAGVILTASSQLLQERGF